MNIYEIINGEDATLVGRYLYELEEGLLLVATPTEPQRFVRRELFDRYIQRGCLTRVDLLEIKWIHPHLYKPIKKLVYEKLK